MISFVISEKMNRQAQIKNFNKESFIRQAVYKIACDLYQISIIISKEKMLLKNIICKIN